MAEGAVWIHDLQGDRQISAEGFAEYPTLSHDGTKVFYLLRLRGRGHFSAGLPPMDDELWQTDLSTGRSEPLSPAFPVTAYSVAPDGKRVAYSSLDGSGKSHIWLASLDRGEAPERVQSPASQCEDTPLFASNGDLFFRAFEQSSNYLYKLAYGRARAIKSTARGNR
jgi:Tol biopolymer transport system component